MSQKIRNELMVMSRELDSKWRGFLNGDMSWFEGFKRPCWCHEQHFYIDERNKILDFRTTEIRKCSKEDDWYHRVVIGSIR